MNCRNAAGAVVVGFLALSPAGAQEMPKPGPEHQILARDVGTWDATVEAWMAPNTPPSLSKGVNVGRLLGGFWLLDEFKSEFMGQPFEGHGTTGYDPAKQKYVGTWVDSMSPGLNRSESTWDPKTQTMSGVNEGPGPDGKPAQTKGVTEWQGPDKKVFSMYAPGPDGKDALMMRITYTRRK
jgi:Protein of unknown function (DUF1579)